MRRGGRHGGDDHRVADLAGVLDRPLDRLLAAEAAAITACRRSIPNRVTSCCWACTMSRTVTTGKRSP
jgi:hypothetical protein